MSKKKNNKNVYQRGEVSSVQQPTRDKSKDKIYAIILCVFIVFWTIASVLGSIGFFRTNAEEIETVPSNTITDDGWIINLDGISGARTFTAQGDLEGSICGSYTLEYQRQADYIILSHSSGMGDTFTVQWSLGSQTAIKMFTCTLSAYDEFIYEDFNVNINGNIDFIVNAIPQKAVYFSGVNGYPFRIDIDFVDTNGVYVGTLPIRQFSAFPNYPASKFQCSYDSRPLSFVTDNDWFSQELKFLPYDASDNFLEGYEQGYTAGRNDGFGVGYNQGVTEAGDYTFSSLIGAVIDVPVHTFLSLFNFELLGIDLAGFFLSLLTVCVIIAVVKLFI